MIKFNKICLFIVCLLSSSLLFAQERPDALKMYREGNYAEAVRICELEISSSPKSIDSYVVLCWSLIANRQYAVAEQRATAGLAVAPYDMRLVESLGEAKYYLGKNNEALAQFERYIAGIPDTGSRIGTAYYYMGEIYVRLAKYQHADIALTAAVKNDPLRDRWWARLGYTREMAHNYKQAIEAYDESLKLNPSQTDAAAGKRRVTQRLG